MIIKSLLTALIGVFLLCSTAKAEMVSFSIDKAVYAGFSATQQQAIIAKVSELNTFFKQEVLPKIPETILEKIKDLKVTILLSDKSGRDGLFVPGEIEHNHKIIVQLINLNSNGIKALLAHEFFHAVHFEINPDEESWMREGMAQLFEYIVTENLSGSNLQASIAKPNTPLIGNYDVENSNPAQYGHDLLYFFYLYNHCGKDNLFWKIAAGTDDLQGAALINSVLQAGAKEEIECKNFHYSAVSFEAAKLHNQMQITKSDIERDRFFLAPTNLPTKASLIGPKDLVKTVDALPDYSSVRVTLEAFTESKLPLKNCKVFYARKSFPYDVSEDSAPGSTRNLEVIIVKTPEAAVLTEVSSKNAGN
jgi:hypothetical protein